MSTTEQSPARDQRIVFIVVGTIAFVTVLYAMTLCVCAIQGIKPPADIISNFKDVGLVALGALGSLLARTGHADQPAKTEITNTAANPVPTEPQPPHPLAPPPPVAHSSKPVTQPGVSAT